MWLSSNLTPLINQVDRFVKSWGLAHPLISHEDKDEALEATL